MTCTGTVDDDFAKVMAYATERARAEGREEPVMAALFDVFNADMPERDADD